MHRLSLLPLLLLLAGCATARPRPADPAPEAKRESPECVAIDAANESEGIAAERRWTAAHFPGFGEVEQALVSDADGRSFDYITIQNATGEKMRVCFDITSFFGKR